LSSRGTVIKKVVLDVLKPLEPSIIEMASRLASISHVNNVIITSVEIDRSTESVKISIEGDDIDMDKIKTAIEELGAVIHSVDEVTSAKRKKTLT